MCSSATELERSAVPAHDERDHEFAEKFGIEIKRVIVNPETDEEENKLPYRTWYHG